MQTGTVHNRDRFLNTIASALGRERRMNITKPKWLYNPQQEVLKDASLDDLTKVLIEQCSNIHTSVFETSTATLVDVLDEVISKYEGESITTWEDPRFEEFGLKEYLAEKLPKSGKHVHVWNPEKGHENIEMAQKADIGITFSDATLAESGTVVLFSSKDKGRSVSLLPKTYIAIVPKSTIVPRMTQVAKQVHEQIQNRHPVPSCVNFITGPSNSADIEMVLIVGVHGPIKATYIIVNDK